MSGGLAFQVLDVGQGSGNLLEFYNTASQLVATALLDLGSEAKKTAAGGPSAQYIVNQLKSMPGGAKLNLVILSHSDSDHINLIYKVLQEFSPDGTGGKPQLVVEKVIYGGTHNKYKKGKSNTPASRNVLDYLSDFFPGDEDERLESLQPMSSSFWSEEGFDPTATIEGANFYILVGNAVPSQIYLFQSSDKPDPSMPESYALNTNSVVMVIDYKSSQFVVLGDATGVTIAACNESIITWDLATELLVDVFMVTAPHHGSETTTFDLLGISTDSDSGEALGRKNLEEFTAAVHSDSVTASAERRGNFGHPSMKVLQAFWPQLGSGAYFDPALTGGKNHFYTAFFDKNQYVFQSGLGTTKWPSTDDWASVQTAENVFTNLYRVAGLVKDAEVPPLPVKAGAAAAMGAAVPPLGVRWTFLVPATMGSKRSVTRSDNRLSLAEAYARLGIPLPAADDPDSPADVARTLALRASVPRPTTIVPPPPIARGANLRAAKSRAAVSRWPNLRGLQVIP